MSDLDKNMAVKSMVVMRKAFRTIDAKVSETFKEFNLTPTQFGVMDVLNAKGRMRAVVLFKQQSRHISELLRRLFPF